MFSLAAHSVNTTLDAKRWMQNATRLLSGVFHGQCNKVLDTKRVAFLFSLKACSILGLFSSKSYIIEYVLIAGRYSRWWL
jgi:hypothetical protein